MSIACILSIQQQRLVYRDLKRKKEKKKKRCLSPPVVSTCVSGCEQTFTLVPLYVALTTERLVPLFATLHTPSNTRNPSTPEEGEGKIHFTN